MLRWFCTLKPVATNTVIHKSILCVCLCYASAWLSFKSHFLWPLTIDRLLSCSNYCTLSSMSRCTFEFLGYTASFLSSLFLYFYFRARVEVEYSDALHPLRGLHGFAVNKTCCTNPSFFSNEELWRTAEETEITIQIKRRKWNWIGHTLRKGHDIIEKEVLDWNPQRQRKRGRPKQTWRRSVHNEALGERKSWGEVKQLARNRIRWWRFVDALCP